MPTYVDETLRRNLLTVIGQGVDFPIHTTEGKQIKMSNAMERINDSIHLILATTPGERLFNPEFGSRLRELLFEPNDDILHRLLKHYTAEALSRWEKRIKITAVQTTTPLDGDDNAIGVLIEYEVRNSHIKGSYVYPFVRDGMPTSGLYTGVEANYMNQKGSLR